MAGVSVKTVSRVINNEKSVKPNNVAKVQQAIAELNYKPDLNARRLRSKQSYLVALLYVDYHGNFYSEMVTSGAIASCDELGYDLILRPVERSNIHSAAELVKHVIDRSNPDGFVLIPPFSDDDRVKAMLTANQKPFVTISSKHTDSANGVGCDEVSAAYQATAYLIEKGHRRICFANYLLGHAAGKWRQQGFVQALEDAGITLEPEMLIMKAFHAAELEADIRRLLVSPAAPTAIFAVNDDVAAMVYRVAHQLNINIPDSLSVVGFDNDPGARLLWPGLTTVKQPIRDLGQAAVKLLINSLILGRSNALVPQLECDLIERGSVCHLS